MTKYLILWNIINYLIVRYLTIYIYFLLFIHLVNYGSFEKDYTIYNYFSIDLKKIINYIVVFLKKSRFFNFMQIIFFDVLILKFKPNSIRLPYNKKIKKNLGEVTFNF